MSSFDQVLLQDQAVIWERELKWGYMLYLTEDNDFCKLALHENCLIVSLE